MKIVVVGTDRLGRPIRHRDPYDRVMAQTKRVGDCLVFTGCHNARGYGRISGGPEGESLAHRIVWRHHNPGERPYLIMHSCDNPPCVEIQHLSVGDHRINAADMVAKGRSFHGHRGASSPRAKISEAMLMEIRDRWARGEQQISIAASVGLHSSYVSRLVRRERRHWDEAA
jgi:hypothetical protein